MREVTVSIPMNTSPTAPGSSGSFSILAKIKTAAGCYAGRSTIGARSNGEIATDVAIDASSSPISHRFFSMKMLATLRGSAATHTAKPS